MFKEVKIVDFNKDSTIGTPAIDIVRILVLQARANVFESLEYYNKAKLSGTVAVSGTLKARLVTWFLEHQAYIKRTDPEQYELIKKDLIMDIAKLREDRILNIICYLNEMLDRLKITKIDTKISYDRTSVEAENLAHHL